MTVGERLKARRKALGLSAEKVAEKLGISPSTIYRYENGDINQMGIDKLGPIAAAVHTTPAYLMGWEDEPDGNHQLPPSPSNVFPMPKFVKKPRLGTIACGKPILAVEEAEEFDDVPEEIHCDFTLKCKGDSMINARIYDGDIVYIRAQKEVENGEIAAVRIGEEATLKRVYYNGNRIILRACNPLYEDMEYEGEALNEIAVLGKAVAFTSLIR